VTDTNAIGTNAIGTNAIEPVFLFMARV
jgi:hypothetical protein